MDGSNNPIPSQGPDSSTIWYKDGNIVFCARKSKFRVYKGILSAQSRKFKDIIAQAQDVNAGTINEDSMLVINLPDDDADLYRFFSAMFDHSFYMAPPSKYSFVRTLSILRLAQKYEVQSLIRHALLQLDSFVCLTRDELMTFANSCQQIEKTPNVLPEWLEALSLADNAGAQWIIPRIVYCIVMVFGLGVIVGHPTYLQQASYQQRLILKGSTMFITSSVQEDMWVGMLPSVQCTDERRCAYVSRTIQEQNKMRPGPVMKPLDLKVDMMVGNRKSFCRNCQAAGTKHQKEFRDACWNQLADICGFGSWEEVKRERSTAFASLQ